MTAGTIANTASATRKGTQDEPVIRVRGLKTRFRTDRGWVTAVDDVSFDVFRGQTLGIVGESGCGKTVTSKSIMRLLPDHITAYEGSARFHDHELLTAGESEMRRIRGDGIAMIFQEPMTSLNPVFTVGWQIDEALKYHTKLNRRERRARGIEMLKLVEIPNPEKRIDEYPHQLSGGMRQRVMIAIALCCEPEVLIADEPTTALDVTIQAQILDLMKDLKEKTGTAIILITHDLGVVAQVCDRVMVMYAGRVIEEAAVSDLFRHPKHPYTRALLESIPKQGNKVKGARLPAIKGIVPSLFELPPGCRFAERCVKKQDLCVSNEPALTTEPDGRRLRCHFPVEQPRSVALTVGGASGEGGR